MTLVEDRTAGGIEGPYVAQARRTVTKRNVCHLQGPASPLPASRADALGPDQPVTVAREMRVEHAAITAGHLRHLPEPLATRVHNPDVVRDARSRIGEEVGQRRHPA